MLRDSEFDAPTNKLRLKLQKLSRTSIKSMRITADTVSLSMPSKFQATKLIDYLNFIHCINTELVDWSDDPDFVECGEPYEIYLQVAGLDAVVAKLSAC